MELTTTPTLELLARVARRQALAAEIKSLQEEMDVESALIKADMMAQGIDSLDAGEWTAALTLRERKTLDKGELVALGVSTETIAKATKVNEYVQLDVRKKA